LSELTVRHGTVPINHSTFMTNSLTTNYPYNELSATNCPTTNSPSTSRIPRWAPNANSGVCIAACTDSIDARDDTLF
ncbi:unnamed protein product, partial [Rotaria magnacalcarata]